MSGFLFASITKKRPLLGAISLAGDVFYIYICIGYQNRTSVWGICHAK